MSEKDTAAAAAAEPAQQFQVLRVFTKDVSFESPRSPEVFLQNNAASPKIALQLNNGARQVGEGLFEVMLDATVTATVEKETLYIAEVKQAGLFRIEGFSSEVNSLLLGSQCPTAIFPFLREAMCDLVVKGGFSQLLLEPINFDALYQQHRQRAAAEEAKKAEADNDGTAQSNTTH